MLDLKKVREESGMTQEELGYKIGVVRQAISNIERGKTRPSVETAQAIGKTLGFDWILFFSDSAVMCDSASGE